MATIRKRGKKWRAELMRDGKRYSSTHETKTAAMAWAVNFKPPELDDSPKTLGDALRRFAEEVAPYRRGARWEIVRCEKMARYEIALTNIKALTPDDFATWRNDQLKRLKGASVTRELTLLKTVFRYAVKEWRWLDASPLAGVASPGESPPRDRRITEEEIAAILAACGYVYGTRPTRVSHRIALAFLFAIETAMRAGELRSLTPQTVDLEKRVARLDITKNGTSRLVPLTTKAVEILRLVDCQFNLTDRSLDGNFRKYRDRAGISGLTFHDSRHEAITRLAKKLPVLDLARMTGHKDIKQLMTYYNESAEDIAQRLD